MSKSKLKHRDDMTTEMVRRLFVYNKQSGDLVFREREQCDFDTLLGYKNHLSRYANRVAGCVDKHHGYRFVRVLGHLYRAHRLIWLYVYGHWPKNDIDHINGDRSDNRLVNLREATRSENHWNKASITGRMKGVKPYPKNKKNPWCVSIEKFGVRHWGGYHPTEDAANTAAKALRQKLHGEFSRHY